MDILISTYRNGIRERKLAWLPKSLVFAVSGGLKSSLRGGIVPIAKQDSQPSKLV